MGIMRWEDRLYNVIYNVIYDVMYNDNVVVYDGMMIMFK